MTRTDLTDELDVWRCSVEGFWEYIKIKRFYDVPEGKGEKEKKYYIKVDQL